MPAFNIKLETESTTCTLEFEVSHDNIVDRLKHWQIMYPRAKRIYVMPYLPNYAAKHPQFASLHKR